VPEFSFVTHFFFCHVYPGRSRPAHDPTIPTRT